MRKLHISFVVPLAVLFVAVFSISASAQNIVCPAGYVCKPISTTPYNGYGTDVLKKSPVSSTCYAFNTDLNIGSTGTDVVALQNWLISNGYNIPSVTSGKTPKGFYGSQTAYALGKYQDAVGITAEDGNFGYITRAKLNASCNNPVVISDPKPTNPTSSSLSIVTVSPSAGLPGAYLTVSGSGFQQYDQVCFAQNELVLRCVSPNSYAPMQMVITVPSMTAGTYGVRARRGDALQSNQLWFTISSTGVTNPTASLSASCVAYTSPTSKLFAAWSAQASGGQAPYKYSWTINNDVSAYGEGSVQSSDVRVSYYTGGSKSAVVRVTDASGITTQATCSGTIPDQVSNTQTSLNVISPNGGEGYVAGQSSIHITWKQLGLNGQQLTAYLYSPTLGNVRSITSYAEYGSADMNLAKGDAIDQPGQYKITLCANNVDSSISGKPVCDSSDSYFNITSPTVAVTGTQSLTPTSQTQTQAGVTLNMTFPSNTVQSKMYLSCPPGVTVSGKANVDCNAFFDVTNMTSVQFFAENTNASNATIVPNYYIYTSDKPNFGNGITGSVVVPPKVITVQAPAFNLVGAPTLVKSNISAGNSSDTMDQYTVTFNVNVTAGTEDVLLGLPASAWPAFGALDVPSPLAQVYKNGVQDSSAPSITASYSQPSNTTLNPGSSFTISRNQSVTIPVVYTFIVKNGGPNTYDLRMTGIRLMSASGVQTLVDLRSKNPSWSIRNYSTGVSRPSGPVSALSPEELTASIWQAVKDYLGGN